MYKNVIKILGCFLIFECTTLHSMQQAQIKQEEENKVSAEKVEQDYKTLHGDLFIYGDFYYAGYHREDDMTKESILNKIEQQITHLDGHAITLKPGDLLTQLRVFSKESDNWSYHPDLGSAVFPGFLPISFFEGKKENDTVEFFFQPNEKKFKIILTCKQRRYDGIFDFEQKFNIRKERFSIAPNYWLPDEEQLIKDGILKK